MACDSPQVSFDEKITLAEAARLIPTRPHPATVYRWAKKGCVASNGERVFLRTWRYGQRVMTTVEAVEGFARELAERNREDPKDRLERPTPPRPRTSAQREKDIERSEHRVEQRGVLFSGS